VKKPARLLAGTLILAYFLYATATAGAHLVRYPDHPRKNHLENRLASQKRNLAHSRYVARRGGGENRRWHRQAVRWITVELAQTRRALAHRLGPVPAIRYVFGPYGWQAVSVADCETGGTFDVNATNGQYRGLFQMGSYARARYGHSSTAVGQARAAYRYFVDSGRDWSPWECRP
jgi:hypothetical protein